jgi:hypothetical protein
VGYALPSGEKNCQRQHDTDTGGGGERASSADTGAALDAEALTFQAIFESSTKAATIARVGRIPEA